MRAEIVSIGEELLSGDSEIVDTNSIFITKMLHDIGVAVHYKTTVGDNEQRITDVIKLALSRVNVVITTGGLGPTVDDMTRQGIANAVNCPLEFRQALMDDLAAKFARFGTRMSDNNRSQATLPQGAAAIPNPVGTAPGFIVEYQDKFILSVPGVPREMKYLIEHSVIPFLREKIGVEGIIKTRVLRTAGIGESLIDEKIGDQERLSNPVVGLAAHIGQTDIRIAARGATEAEADALIAEVEAEVRKRMGEFIFGVEKESLDQAFVNAVQQAKIRVALAEIGTGDLLRHRLENLPGAAHSFEIIPAATLQAIRAQQTATDVREVAMATARAILAQTSAGVALVIISEQRETAIAVTNGSETRSREYAYGSADEPGTDGGSTAGTALLGGPEWAIGWGLSMAWYLVTSTMNAEEGKSTR